MSLVVADTGEIESIRKFRPVDCTTNPSLVLKAVQNPQYAHYLPKAIDAEDGPISNSERCASLAPIHACGLHPSSSCCCKKVGLVGARLRDGCHFSHLVAAHLFASVGFGGHMLSVPCHTHSQGLWQRLALLRPAAERACLHPC